MGSRGDCRERVSMTELFDDPTAHTKIKCPQCNTLRKRSAFLGKKGQLVRRCYVCTAKYRNWGYCIIYIRPRSLVANPANSLRLDDVHLSRRLLALPFRRLRRGSVRRSKAVRRTAACARRRMRGVRACASRLIDHQHRGSAWADPCDVVPVWRGCSPLPVPQKDNPAQRPPHGSRPPARLRRLLSRRCPLLRRHRLGSGFPTLEPAHSPQGDGCGVLGGLALGARDDSVQDAPGGAVRVGRRAFGLRSLRFRRAGALRHASGCHSAGKLASEARA